MRGLLTDWYFTQCVQMAESAKDETLIDLQRLRMAELDDHLVEAAIARLGGTDRRVRVYSTREFSRLLACAKSERIRTAASEALTLATVNHERSIVSAGQDLVEAVTSRVQDAPIDREEVTQAWHDLADYALHERPEGERSPYFHLASESVAVLALSTATSFAQVDEEIRHTVEELLGQDASESRFRDLVDECVSGVRGRLPFLLGLELVASNRDPNAGMEVLYAAVARGLGSFFEPDILVAAAWLDPPSEGQLLDELCTMTRLDALLERSVLDELPPALARRLGIGAIDPPVFHAALWQQAVLATAIVGDRDHTDDLAEVLQPRPQRCDADVFLAGNSTGEGLAVRRGLAKLSGGSVQLQQRKRRRDATHPDRLAPVLASPWMVAEFDEDDVPSYPAARTPLATLRLSVCAAAACEVLAARPPGDFEPDGLHTSLMLLALHAESVFDRSDRDSARQPGDGLRAACHRSLRDLTTGYVNSVAPRRITDVLDQADDRMARSLPVPDATRLVDELLSRRLSWISAAATHFDEAAGPARWKSLVVPVIEDMISWPDPDHAAAAAVNGLLSGLGQPHLDTSSVVDVAEWPDLARVPGGATVGEILLSPTTSAEDWSLDSETRLDHSAALALAVRRVECEDAGERPDFDSRLDELVDALNRAHAHGHLEIHLLARVVACAIAPGISSRADLAEQLAATGLDSNEPVIWSYVLELSGRVHDVKGGLDQLSWRVATGALRRIVALDGAPPFRARVACLSRSLVVELMHGLDDTTRGRAADLLAPSTELDGGLDAATALVPIRAQQQGIGQSALRAGGLQRRTASWQAAALCIDQVTSDHVVLTTGLDDKDLDDGFPPRGNKRDILASVVESDRDRVTLYSGDGTLVSASWRHDPPQPGELVRLSQRKGDRRASPFARVPPVGQAVSGRLRSIQRGQGRLLQFQPYPRVTWEGIDNRLWDADTSRAFIGRDEDLNGRAVAVQSPNGEWVPHPHDALALVVELARRQEPATLVYNGDHEDGLLFSAAPGEQYLIRPSDLTDTAAEGLAERLDDHRDAAGLLVTFALGDAGAFDLSDDPPRRGHVELQCPFDERNFRWRDALRAYDEAIHVTQEGGNASLAVLAPTPDFPSEIELTVRAARRGPLPPAVFVSLPSFSSIAQRTGQLDVKADRAESLRGNEATLLDELWLDEAGWYVTLDRVVGGLSPAGTVPISTTSGFLVAVPPESISMAPLVENELRDMRVRGRRARVRLVNAGRGRTVSVPLSVLSPVIAAAVRQSNVRGLVWSVRRGDSSTIEVVLDLEGHPREGVPLGDLRAHVGNRVVLSADGESVDVTVVNPWREADATWRESSGVDDGAIFLGNSHPRSPRFEGVVEVSPGEVALVEPNHELLPFSVMSDGSWGAPLIDWSTCIVERANDEDRLRRTWVSSKGSVLTGLTDKATRPGRGELRSTQITVYRDGESITLRRNLRLTSRKVVRPKRRTRQKPAPDAEEAHVDPAAELERMLDAGLPVPVVVEGNNPRSGQIEELLQLGCTRPEATLPVVDEMPVLVSASDYGRTGRAQIVRTEGGGFGLSFAETPDLNVEAYAGSLGAVPGDEVRPASLYYAKVVDGFHVFEFGWGQRVAATEAQLRFDGGPFRDVERVLFHGDKIGVIAFVEDGDETLLDIRQASISASVGTRLYRQARDLRFLHLLRVGTIDGQVHVSQIDGFNDTVTVEPMRSYRGRPIAHATLDLDEDTRLDDDRATDRTIYGQLDIERFEESAGLELLYRPRRLTIEDLHEIGHSVVTFVRGGDIEAGRNELLLRLSSATTETDDLAPDVAVTRRGFSVDVNQLSRLERLEGSAALNGALLVAHVAVSDDGRSGAGVVAQLRHRAIPNRATSSLRDLTTEGGLLLLVDRIDTHVVRLEYRHGIFFVLGSDEIDERPTDLREGATVRVDPAGGDRFRLTWSSPSERRFFRRRARALVALPTNPLLRNGTPDAGRDPNLWRERSSGFVAGGLPGEIASSAAYDSDSASWSGPKPRALDAMMRRRHPKIGLFGHDQGRRKMSPAPASVKWGGLDFGPSGRPVAVVDGDEHAVDPSIVTFGDEPAQSLKQRAEALRWRYHDLETGVWDGARVKRDRLRAHSPKQGPLFFQDGHRLRYIGDLDAHSFPSTFLTEGIQHRGRDLVAAVAGISRDAKGRPDGLYLEFAPGVICLVLDSLLRFRFGTSASVPLAQVSMSSFGVGDIVKVQVDQDPSRSVDSVDVVAWNPSGRPLAGFETETRHQRSARLLAPVVRSDEAEGELVLGAGAVRISMATWRPPPSGAIFLTPNNAIRPSDGDVRAGDSVLLSLPERGIGVHGLPGYAARPSKEKDWKEHHWHDDVFPEPGGPPRTGRLREAIKAMGGAMVATVEWVDRRGKKLGFSLSRQTEREQPGRAVLATVLGHEGEALVLRAGSATVRLFANRVVSGVRASQVPAVAAVLIENRIPIWLHHADGGMAAAPIELEDYQSDRFTATAAVVDASANGLIVRQSGSWALAWLPADQLALAQLKPADWGRLWLTEPRPTLNAAAVRSAGDSYTPAVSILEHEPVRVERLTLQPGRRADVTLRAPAAPDGDRRWFVAETRAGTLIECTGAGVDDWTAGDQLAVEIQAVDASWTRVTAVPLGERRIQLDLPIRLFTSIPRPGVERREFRRFVELLNHGTAFVEAESRINRGEADLSAAELLGWSYVAPFGGDPASAEAAAMAAQWARRTTPESEIDLIQLLVAVLSLLRGATAAPADILSESGLDDVDAMARSQTRWAHLADRLLGSLGRRSVRSIHSEAIGRYWFRLRDRQAGVPWRRLEELAAVAGQAMTPHSLRALRSVIDYLDFAAGIEGRLVAAALRAASGEERGLRFLLLDEDLLLPSLVRLVRITDPLLSGHPADRLPLQIRELQIAHLEAAVDRIQREREDVVLLPAPPWFVDLEGGESELIDLPGHRPEVPPLR
ncbi:MAG: hypothetical protein GY788_23405 [bacterium]|nr:hypothetical protein [bacterium]